MKSSSANSTPLLLSALIIALLAAIYYYFVMPKTDEVSQKEASVASLQANVASLETQIASLNESQAQEVSNEFAIRKKLPDSRGIETLLLNIEEIEYVTDTRILSLNFNSYDTLVNSSNYTDPNAPKTTEDPNATGEAATATASTTAETTAVTTDTNSTTEQTTQMPTEAPISTIDVLTLPTNLKMITFNLEVEAPNNQQLVLFLKEIEKLERVMHIDTISFSLPGEENEFDEEASDVVTTSVQVTTFYYE